MDSFTEKNVEQREYYNRRHSLNAKKELIMLNAYGRLQRQFRFPALYPVFIRSSSLIT